MKNGKDIKKKPKALKKIILPILRHSDVVRAGVFGSFLRGELKKKSDIDILVKFKGRKSLLDLVGLKLLLEERLISNIRVIRRLGGAEIYVEDIGLSGIIETGPLYKVCLGHFIFLLKSLPYREMKKAVITNPSSLYSRYTTHRNFGLPGAVSHQRKAGSSCCQSPERYIQVVQLFGAVHQHILAAKKIQDVPGGFFLTRFYQ